MKKENKIFDLSTVPSVKISEKQIGPISVKIFNGNHFTLHNNGERWMVYNFHTNREVKEFYSMYDMAYGDVLLSGLGFGILALWIASKPEVTSVTVVEVTGEIIYMFTDQNELPPKVKIIKEDINKFSSDQKFDCLFLDHYEENTFEDRIANANEIMNKIDHDLFWFWSLEHILAQFAYGITDHQLFFNYLDEHRVDFSVKFEEFGKKYFPFAKFTQLSDKKINEYVYTYFDKIGYGNIIKL